MPSVVSYQYQVVPEVTHEDEKVLTPPQGRRPYARKNHLPIRVISVLVVLGIFLTLLHPEIILPLSLTMALKTRSAQQTADMSRASLMSSYSMDPQEISKSDQPQLKNTASSVVSTKISKNKASLRSAPLSPSRLRPLSPPPPPPPRAPNGCEATVMIVRHCEKGQVTEHCAYVGFERSAYMATLFGNDHGERWPAPSYIFAMGPGGRNKRTRMNFREIETVGPMAKKLNLTVNDKFETEDTTRLAIYLQNLLNSGEMCGKVALVSWHHTGISQLANRLGCGPNEGCPIEYSENNYDDVWQIKFAFSNLTHSVEESLALPDKPEWYIFGSVQQQGFDPLAYSKQSGDYPAGGTAVGMRWKPLTTDIPERTRPVEGWSSVQKPDYLLPDQQPLQHGDDPPHPHQIR